MQIGEIPQKSLKTRPDFVAFFGFLGDGSGAIR